MKFLLFLSLLSCSTQAKKIRVVHYNIKELDSTKIENHSSITQLIFATEILKKLNPDILSINEIQFDKVAVPNKNFNSEGENFNKLLKISGLDFLDKTFNEANTGKNSRTDDIGNYVLKPNQDQRSKLADKVNFGMFPGQYSTAGAFKYKILKKVVITDLKWKDFNPDVDLTKYKDMSGEPLPEDMELFDKNFSDITLDIQGKDVHIILLHTVPAYGFGNPHSPNIKRNHDQLEFLKWYLTRKSKFKYQGEIKPLKENSTFIAMGDWNVDPKSKNLGAKVINELASTFKLWQGDYVPTYIGQSFSPGEFKAQLDYILMSNNILVSNSGVYLPDPRREELGCGNILRKPFRPKKVKVTYKVNDKKCYALVDKEFYKVKKASDHLPIWADIIID